MGAAAAVAVDHHVVEYFGKGGDHLGVEAAPQIHRLFGGSRTAVVALADHEPTSGDDRTNRHVAIAKLAGHGESNGRPLLQRSDGTRPPIHCDTLMCMHWSVRVTKRTIDVVGSAVGLALTAPLFPVLAAVVYIDSPGPIFFRQRRAGKLKGVAVENGTRTFQFAEFEIHKFRTMRPDAEKHTGPVLAEADDPRITRVGRFLRKSRLDEIPQLWDVLCGTMSLVGPRPERPELLRDLAFAIPLFEERMRDVKPGVTGLAQISLRYTGALQEGSELAELAKSLQNPFGLDEAEGAVADDMRLKMLYDLAYLASLERFGTFLAMELKVILKTPLVMLKGSGQ